jgi:superfamily I DNA/RNA helicase
MRWDDNLSGSHLTIASSTSKRIAILAGPGTGKTSYGLLRRIMRLLQDANVSPEKILFLTFSRTSAEDFKNRLDTMGIENAQKIESATIHSYCLKILKTAQVFKSTGRNANRILMNYEEDTMLQDLSPEFGNLTQKKKLLGEFSSGWAESIDEYPGNPKNEREKKFQDAIMSWLYSHNAMLIGEVVPVAYKFLAANPMSDFLNKHTHTIVDEYQDLNKVEQEIIELLVGAEGHICVAGDDDQSIYKFRCANPDGIRQFFEKADEKVTIEICGRCPKPILDIANKIKEFLPNSSKGPMTALDESIHGSVSVIQWKDSTEESAGIASTIKHTIDGGKRVPGDFLVLVQSKSLGISLRKNISDFGIEAHSFFQEDPIGNNESKRAFTLLQLLVNPTDPVALRYWLGYGDANARRDQYAELRKMLDARKILLSSLLDELISGNTKTPGFSIFIKRYVELKKILLNLNEKSVTEIVDIIFPDGTEELEDLRQIALISRQVATSLTELLYDMSKVISQPEIPEHPDFVRVMSLHKSKGLTSKVVFVAALVEGIAPKKIAYVDEEEMHECRRLFYVAVTRAKEELILSTFASIPVSLAKRLQIEIGKWLRPVDGVRYVQTITSRFITEIAPVLPSAQRGTNWLKSKEVSTQEEK